jgi:hypothetical protein
MISCSWWLVAAVGVSGVYVGWSFRAVFQEWQDRRKPPPF